MNVKFTVPQIYEIILLNGKINGIHLNISTKEENLIVEINNITDKRTEEFIKAISEKNEDNVWIVNSSTENINKESFRYLCNLLIDKS